ncbi:Crp/Fnr family transcriptional regulator [Mycobacterium marinum]|uniref:Crp/Fnr family transcriptional regulator n=1 Tax=Mycobacterium marinum TaxID=1781 RepID=UPI002359FD99|nr:Crp/Fnr family transcriptional regulator [Mycobacterium marinum]MDC8982520.1 Crp/Fnr family transcriptional regulator [Mycobacterium marinum]MDC8999034.1 Crp/Fnr family transcriptional regulator [Mycobacterium marinum]MDC9011544.1 Crp/Fnr family transcriptional regulator [Mycobacterium marinum]
MSERRGSGFREAVTLFTGGAQPSESQVRHAAWVARCVGRGAAAPLHPNDLTALAGTLSQRQFTSGAVLFNLGQDPTGVWIVRQGQIELAVGSGRQRAVVDVLRGGDVDGDIPLLLEMPMAYTARALEDSTCLYLDRANFESLLAGHPNIARRWLSSVAQRVSAGQARLIALLGRPLPAQVAQLLLDESSEGSVQLAQRTLSAMLGVQRPSLNKILKGFERDGLIAVGYAEISIVDVNGLSARAR